MEKQEVLKKAVAYIESLPNGANTTTNRVAHLIDADFPESFDDLLDLHVKIMEAVEEHGIVSLDYSSHDDKVEGLPYNLDFVVERKQEPDYYTCGVPDIDKMTEEQLFAELQKGVEDAKAGRVKPADEVFAELREKYNLK